MSDELTMYVFEGESVRVVGDADAPLFVAKDVCKVLGVSQYRDAVARLDEDERVSVLVDTLGGAQEATACLLYTSPSPRDKRQSRMPSSA